MIGVRRLVRLISRSGGGEFKGLAISPRTGVVGRHLVLFASAATNAVIIAGLGSCRSAELVEAGSSGMRCR